MEKDSHYYAVYFLCLASGLDPDEAYEIAYSSQYVDDAKDGHTKILLDTQSKKVGEFEPIRTAHNGFESVGIDVQEKIYYPFHFLPGLDGKSFEEKMITKAGKQGKLFQKVINGALESKDPFRIGISLHVLADTFAHTNFSGLWSWSNDVNRVDYIPAKRNWFSNLIGKLGWKIKRKWFAAAPPIGHSNAFTFPDRSFLNWKYTDYNCDFQSISNSFKYIHGFLTVYEELIEKYAKSKNEVSRLKESGKNAKEELRQILRKAVYFAGNLKKRCKNWQELIKEFENGNFTLPDDHLDYNESAWEKEVLKDKKKFFIFSSNKKKLKVPLDNFLQSRFNKFHEAAKAHREFVLQELIEFREREEDPTKTTEVSFMFSQEILEKTRQKRIFSNINE